MKSEEAINSEELATFIAQYPACRRISIHRLDEKNDRWIYVGASAPQQVTEEFIQRKYARKHGGGMFTVKLHEESGQIIKTKWNIPIGDPVDDDEPARPAPLAPLAIAGPAGGSELDLLREELRANRELMREMIQAFSRGSSQHQQTSVVDLVGALAQLKKLEPPPAPLATDLFVKGMEAAMKLNRVGNGSDGETSWLDFAREVLLEAKPLLAKALSAAPADDANGAGAAGEDPNVELREAIAFLKARCAAGNTVPLWAAYILENLDKATVEQIAAQPFAEFVAVDPDLGTEPYKTWFVSLQGTLNAALHNSQHSNGAGGNGSDVKPNGGAGAASAAPADRAAAGAKVNRRAATH